LRADVIDYLLSQDLRLLLRTAVEQMRNAVAGGTPPTQALVPIETYSRYSLP